MKPKYRAIIILATAAICAGVVYYLDQPISDLGPITIHHVVKTAVTPSFGTSSSSIDISGWQTYTNSQYGFELKYPVDWQDVNGTGQGEILDIVYQRNKATHAEGVGYSYPGEIFLRGITKKSILVPYGSTPPANFLDFAKEYDVSGLDNQGNVVPLMAIDGHQAVQINAPDNLTGPDKGLVPNITLLIDYSSDSVIWVEVNYFYENKDYVSKTFNQILSTFKFIAPVTPPTAQTDTSGWKTYTNSHDGYQIQYPSDISTSYSNGDLRLQNYPSTEDNFKSGEFFMDIFATDIETGFKSHIDNVQTYQFGNATGYGGGRADADISPLDGYDIYIPYNGKLYVMASSFDTTELKTKAFVLSVAQTFKFTPMSSGSGQAK